MYTVMIRLFYRHSIGRQASIRCVDEKSVGQMFFRPNDVEPLNRQERKICNQSCITSFLIIFYHFVTSHKYVGVTGMHWRRSKWRLQHECVASQGCCDVTGMLKHEKCPEVTRMVWRHRNVLTSQDVKATKRCGVTRMLCRRRHVSKPRKGVVTSQGC